ncbi:MAG: peptidyl-prolyl cis-trans isomerase [Candidatus Omnitrophica bacterium]|nr:peptidyl-prolyl cis-trans isomerase [Candidatus Omnitrophota bacterium]
MNRRILLVLFCAIMVIIGCDKLPMLQQKKSPAKKSASVSTAFVGKGPIVAKVNGTAVTLEDLNQDIEAYNASVPADKPELKITTRDKKIEYLKNDKVRQILLYQEALKQGLDKKEDILLALEKTKQNLLVLELVRKETENVDVTSGEIEEYYNLYKDKLKEPEERQIREIMVPSEQDAKDIMIQLLQGADFATIAKDRSRAKSAASGGDLGYLQRGKKSEQFDTVAFSDSLEVGKVSSIFKGPDGYYIVKLEGKRGGKQKTLSEMWDDIKRALVFLKQQQKMENMIDQLNRGAKIEIIEGEIK